MAAQMTGADKAICIGPCDTYMLPDLDWLEVQFNARARGKIRLPWPDSVPR